MIDGESGIVDRFLSALERAPGIVVVDRERLVLSVPTGEDRRAELHVEREALLVNARLAADDPALHGLAGADALDRSFTLFFLHLQAALETTSGRRRFRYTARGVLPVDGRADVPPS